MIVKIDQIERDIAQLRERVAGEEDNVEALVRLGTLLCDLRRLPEAEEYLSEARRLDPAYGQAHLYLARVLWGQRKFADAEAEYAKAARLLPDKQGITMELVELLYRRGEKERADKLLQELHTSLKNNRDEATGRG